MKFNLDECFHKECSGCEGCPADEFLWNEIESAYNKGFLPPIKALDYYYKIRAKYETFLQNGKLTSLGYPEQESILRRY
ncbi:MAG: hypothetical protein ACXAC7_04810 [Candidatus Hodarchaeales archaeon]